VEAISGVLRSLDTEFDAPHLLFQAFRYVSEAEAQADLSNVTDQARLIASMRWMLPNSNFLDTDANKSEIKSFSAINEFGIGGCLLTFVDSEVTFVLRHTMRNAVETVEVDRLSESIIKARDDGSDASLLEPNLENWKWTYGPLDIHPAVYDAPLCSAGI
jgi:hypothetical protein